MTPIDPTMLILLGAAALGFAALIFSDDDSDSSDEEDVGSEANVTLEEGQTSYDIQSASSVSSNADITVTGNDDDNLIVTGSGDDVIYSGGSVSAINDDIDSADYGDPISDGNVLGNFIRSDAGDDVIYGGDGSDIILTGAGDNEAYGGDGSDAIIDADFTRDEFIETFGPNVGPLEDILDTDEQNSDGSDDIVYGGAGFDQIFQLFGSDTVYGGAGDDELGTFDYVTGSGSDVVYGGTGADNIAFDDGDIVTGGAGVDNFFVSVKDGLSEAELLEWSAVVITDFDLSANSEEFLSYVNNENEDGSLIYFSDGYDVITEQVGDDVWIGIDLADDNGDLDGVIDFHAITFLNASNEDVGTAFDADRISVFS